MKKQVMEFIGTFFFILTIVGTGNALAIASMFMAWLYIGAYVSGAHYNPMVTLAVALRNKTDQNKFDLHEIFSYIAAQILGAFTAFVAVAFFKGGVEIPEPGDVTLLQAFLIEVLLAFVLALIILVVATPGRYKESRIFGFAIGFTIPALLTIGSKTSGGLFNPAISIGAAFYSFATNTPVNAANLLMYVGGAFLGGILAALFFKHFVRDVNGNSH